MTWLAILLRILCGPGEAEALRSTAPADLTVETARENLIAARIAAAEYHVDPNLLLSIGPCFSV